ncbi:non-heme iron oxygenase ferredoxin subunit [Ottowia thiooxydans]|uniref:non-heme iron oxygenase ferredoxin subunit n=1 Tax=Ottowia thiooxydans TaxID=219182 RepID=UPI000429C5D4|nr:non-heme iron oxygenase ferredoxin subunit [Ottowia thiooxydans]
MSQWIDVAAEDEIFEGSAIAVTPQGRDIAVYKTESGEVFATNNICSHGNARLCDGYLEGHEVECPHHQGRFDIRSGQPTEPPCIAPIKTYPVKINGGRVFLEI